MLDPEFGNSGAAAEEQVRMRGAAPASNGGDAPAALASASPSPQPPRPPTAKKGKKKPHPWFANARRANVWSVKVVFLCSFYCFWKERREKREERKEGRRRGVHFPLITSETSSLSLNFVTSKQTRAPQWASLRSRWRFVEGMLFYVGPPLHLLKRIWPPLVLNLIGE